MEKKNIIVIDDHIKSSELYSSSLEVYLNANVTLFSSPEHARLFLDTNKVDAIITRSRIGNLNSDTIFYERIRSNKKKVFLYVLGKSKLSIHAAKIFKNNFEIPNLIKSIAKDLEVTPKSMASLELGEYYPFKTKNIIKNLCLVCNIFIKKDQEFSKLLSADNYFSPDVLSILNNQDCDTVYVKASQRLSFINSQLMFFQELLAEDELSVKDEFMLTNMAYKLIKSSVLEMNISPEIILTTERCIDTIQSIVQKIPDLNNLYETLKDSDDLDFNQTIILCFICNHLIENIEWGTNEQKIKLTFVSFFHNITLPSSYILINSNEALDRMNITKEEMKKVLKHALDSAKVVSKFKSKIPLGVDTIIKQHHGSLDGYGFNSFPQSISPLAIIFLVADEWVTHILKSQKNNYNITKHELMSIVKSKYKTLSFEKVIKAFEKINI